MKVNLRLNEKGIIVGYTSYPLDEGAAVEVDKADIANIIFGVSSYENGEIMNPEDSSAVSLAQNSRILSEIYDLEKQLTSTDSGVVSYVAGELTEDEFEKLKKERISLKTQISELKNML